MPAPHLLPLNLNSAQVTLLHNHYDHLVGYFEKQIPFQRGLLAKLQPLLSEILFMQPQFAELYAMADLTWTQIRLQHEDERIMALPWQIACLDRPTLHIDLSRSSVTPYPPSYQVSLPLPLKVLIMVSGPEDEGIGLSFEEEEALILKAFQPLLESSNVKVQIDYTDDGSLNSLKDKLEGQAYHVLHFSGHGAYHNGHGYLLLEHPDSMAAEFIQAEKFAKIIASAKHTPPLVLLSACQSGQGRRGGAYQGVAQHLLDAGIPSVIGMRHSILDQAAITFAHQFYSALAQKESIPNAFNRAIVSLRQKEEEDLKNNISPQAQWLIPQLFLRQKIGQVVNWQAESSPLKSESVKYLTDQNSNRLLLEPQPNFRFIGRRRERKQAIATLRNNQPVLIRGMGGVGKTALAEHLILKLISADSRTHLFFLNEKPESRSLDNLLEQILLALETKGYSHLRSELTILENQNTPNKMGIFGIDAPQEVTVQEVTLPEKKIHLLLRILSKEETIKPVFVFDNLESFQTKPGEEFSPEFSDISLAIHTIIKQAKFPCILTCRYPIKDFPDIQQVNLNQISYADLYKKIQTLSLSRIAIQLAISPQIFTTTDKKTGLKKSLRFSEVVECLHQTLGGNYRAIELFNAIYIANQGRMLMSLRNLKKFEKKLSGEYHTELNDALQNHARKVVFGDLYGLLSNKEKEVLHTLIGFRVPVSSLALEYQGIEGDLIQILESLNHLTLIDKNSGNTEKSTFKITELVRLYIKKKIWIEDIDYIGIKATKKVRRLFSRFRRIVFFHQGLAAKYFLDVANTPQKIAYHEEAFWHYAAIKSGKRLVRLGENLCEHFWSKGQYDKSIFYSEKSIKLDYNNYNYLLHVINGMAHLLKGNYSRAESTIKKGLKGTKKNSPARRQALATLGALENHQGRYSNAITYFEKAAQIDSIEENDKNKMMILSGLLVSQSKLGDIQASEQTMRKLLEYVRRNSNEESSYKDEFQTGYVNIFLATLKSGNLIESEKYLRLAESIVEKSDTFTLANIYNNFGALYYLKRDYNHSIAYFEKCLRLSKRDGIISPQISSYTGLGNSYLKLSQFNKAIAFFEKSIEVMMVSGSRTEETETRALLGISSAYSALGMQDKSNEFAQEALKVSRTSQGLEGEVETLNHIALQYLDKGNYKDAIKLFKESLNAAEKSGFLISKGAIYNNLGLAFLELNKLEIARTYLLKSLNLSKDFGLSDNTIYSTFNNLGMIEAKLNNMEKALGFYEKALSNAIEKGAKKEEGICNINIASAYRKLEKIELAETFCKKGLSIFEKINYKRGIAQASNGLALVYESQGKIELVLSSLKLSLKIYRELEDKAGIGMVLNNIGAFYFDHGNYEPAIHFFITSHSIHQEIGSPNMEKPESFLNSVIEKIGEDRYQQIVSQYQSNPQKYLD